MKKDFNEARIYLLAILFFAIFAAAGYGGEALPDSIRAQLPADFALNRAGVYPLKDGKFIAVGAAKLRGSLRESRAVRRSLDLAENDAKRRLAQHLFPAEFAKHKSIAVTLKQVRRVAEKPASGENSFVALLADRADVAVAPAPEIIIGAEKVAVAPEFVSYLQDDPTLQLGGGRIFSRDDGWIALGVGLAELSGATGATGDDSVAEREARKLARMDAHKNLTETIFGSDFSVLEQAAETASERDGIVKFREWSSKRTREKIAGELKQVAEIGEWQTDGYLAVVVAVGAPPLDVADETAEIPDYPEWQVDEKWEFALLSNPPVLRGGAALWNEGEEIFAIAVGSAKLTGNAANDKITAPRLAKMSADRELVKFLTGFSAQSETVAREEISRFIGDGGETSAVTASLTKITREKAAGIARGMTPAGSWRSVDNKILYQAFVAEVAGN